MGVAGKENGNVALKFLGAQALWTAAFIALFNIGQYVVNGVEAADALNDMTAGSDEYKLAAPETWDVDLSEVHFNDPLSTNQWAKAALGGVLFRIGGNAIRAAKLM